MTWREVKEVIGLLGEKIRASGFIVEIKTSSLKENPKKEFCKIWVKEKENDKTRNSNELSGTA